MRSVVRIGGAERAVERVSYRMQVKEVAEIGMKVERGGRVLLSRQNGVGRRL